MAVSWYDPMEWDISTFNQFGEYGYQTGEHVMTVDAIMYRDRQCAGRYLCDDDLVKWIRIGVKRSFDTDYTWTGGIIPKISSVLPIQMWPNPYRYPVSLEWVQPTEDMDIYWALSYALVGRPEAWYMSDIVKVSCHYDPDGAPPGEIKPPPEPWDILSCVLAKKETYIALGIAIGAGAAASVLPSPMNKYASVGAAGGAAYFLYQVYKCYKEGG